MDSLYGFEITADAIAILTWRKIGIGHVLDLTDNRRIFPEAHPQEIAVQLNGQIRAPPHYLPLLCKREIILTLT